MVFLHSIKNKQTNKHTTVSCCSTCTQLQPTWSTHTQLPELCPPFSALLVPLAPLVTVPNVRAITAQRCDNSHWSLPAPFQTLPSDVNSTTEQCVAAVGDTKAFQQQPPPKQFPCAQVASASVSLQWAFQFQHGDGFKGRKNENKGKRLPSLHLNVVCISVLMRQFLQYLSCSCDLLSTRVYLYRYQQTNSINKAHNTNYKHKNIYKLQ